MRARAQRATGGMKGGRKSKEESVRVKPPIAKSRRRPAVPAAGHQQSCSQASWGSGAPWSGVRHPLSPAAPKQPSAALLLRALAACAHCHGNQLSWHLESGSHQQGGPQVPSNKACFPPKSGPLPPLSWEPSYRVMERPVCKALRPVA